MNDVIASARAVVRTAEASLRALMQDAVSDGQYDRVAVLAGWAERLAQIGAKGPTSLPDRCMERGIAAADCSTLRTESPKTRAKSKRGTGKYPTFCRVGDALVKTAWSKSSKSEYQHQAPRDVAVTLLRRMQTLARDEELLTMDAVLPLTMDDGSEAPAYQSYVCLAWLRDIGAVTQHGRRGYSVDSEAAVEQAVEQSWSDLPLLTR